MFFVWSQEVKSVLGFLYLMVDIEVPFQVIANVCAKKLQRVSYCICLAIDEDRCFY